MTDDFLEEAIAKAKKAGFPSFLAHYNYGNNWRLNTWFAAFYREYHLSYGSHGQINGKGKTLKEAIIDALSKLPQKVKE